MSQNGGNLDFTLNFAKTVFSPILSFYNKDMKNEKILIVDDDKDLRVLIRETLSNNGYKNVLTVKDGKEALELMRTDPPELVILDVMMPEIDGIEVLKTIRESSKTPVIMLTARGEDEDRIRGFEYGADDYVVKPFLMRELILRIEALLRRTYPSNRNIIDLDYAMVELDKAKITRKDGTELTLTAKELEILKKLYENSGSIVSVNALCQSAIGDIFTGYENTLMSHIRHLREKIEENPSRPKSLVTIRGLGYKLNILEDIK